MLSLLAQAAPAAEASGPAGLLSGPLPLIAVMFAIFYFMIIRPQQKQQKQLQGFLGGLQKGDEVVTTAGIIGKIAAINEQFITLEVANNVKVRVLKSNIVGPFQPKPAEAEKPADEAAKK